MTLTATAPAPAVIIMPLPEPPAGEDIRDKRGNCGHPFGSHHLSAYSTYPCSVCSCLNFRS